MKSITFFIFKVKTCYNQEMFKIELLKTNRMVDMIVLHIIVALGLLLYLPIMTLLYPIGHYFVEVLEIFFVISFIGWFLMYKKPKIARNLFVTTVVGTFLTILFYILTTEQNYSFFTFIFTILSSSLMFLLVPVWFLSKTK